MQKRCASCGDLRVRGLSLYPPDLPNQAHLFCAGCIRRLEEGENLYLVFTREFEPPNPPEEGFWWLFKAARVLIREGVSDEDQIIPTLVFAHEIDRGAAGGTPAASYRTDPPLMPHLWNTVRTVDGIDILEEVPIHADILVNRPPPDQGGEAIPQGVLIQVSFHKKAVEAEHVASVYVDRLTARGMRFGSSHSGSLEYEFVGNRLYLTVKSTKETPVVGTTFSPPHLVKAFYSGLLDEFANRLTARGRVFEAENLILASVAFLLRASGGLASRKEIHRLLNKHVYGAERLPETGYGSNSVTQLWRDVPKAGSRIARMLPRIWGRPFSEHF